MRYIGNKRLLVNHIEEIINENTKDVNSFIDIFAGTGSVGKYFKEKYQVLSNDYLFFAYALQRAYIVNNKIPDFKGLQENLNIHNPIDYFNSIPLQDIQLGKGFIYRHYSPNENNERMYFTNENAIKIDFVRQTIQSWLNEKYIQENEFYYLLTSLLEATTPISNTSGTYGAYLKKWDSRALQPLIMSELDILDNQKENKAFNEDANALIRHIKGDILYLDPPYNTRQYVSNYHLLETIAKYNEPTISGKTGLPVERNKSSYSSKRKVYDALNELIEYADVKYIVMSYSTDGILPVDDIMEILNKHCKINTIKMFKIPYRRFKSNNAKQDEDTLYELVFIAER